MRRIDRTATCPICGKEFKPRIHHGKLQVYCSNQCANSGKIKRIKRVCQVCGKEFDILPCDLKKGKGLYCSWACQRSTLRNRVILVCQFCGKEFERKKSLTNGNQGKFCCRDCKDKGQQYLIGPLNPNYRPEGPREYCEKWTPDLRRRVREYFGNTCMMCGIHQDDYNTLLHVHHVNYNKKQCCDENIPRLLIPLCRSCHTKTTVKRKFWEPILTNLIMNCYNGRCYYTKEEYKQILLERKE